jgi:hypothetical protein
VKKAVLCHRNAQKCHVELQEAVGDHILSYETVARWIQAFRIGGVSTAYMHHNGCSMSVHTDMSVANSEQCVDKNRYWISL